MAERSRHLAIKRGSPQMSRDISGEQAASGSCDARLDRSDRGNGRVSPWNDILGEPEENIGINSGSGEYC